MGVVDQGADKDIDWINSHAGDRTGGEYFKLAPPGAAIKVK